MKTHSLFLLLCLASLTACAGPGIPGLQNKLVRFQITDMEGRPVPGAKLETSRVGSGSNSAIADESGTVSFRVHEEASLFVDASADGFHSTAGEIWRGGIYKNPQGKLVARKIPDAFTIVLKPVLDPVPMIHHMVMEALPETNTPVAYDLLARDWVKPYGRGSVPDLLFLLENSHDNDVEKSTHLTLSFPNSGDGIQPFTAAYPFSMDYGSNLAPPHLAPLQGYRSSHRIPDSRQAAIQANGASLKNRHYLFRTRTRMDPDGRIRKACYGYILGEFIFTPFNPRGPSIQFKYVFNPDPDPDARSLESERFVRAH